MNDKRREMMHGTSESAGKHPLTLAQFNALPNADAEELLRSCCGSSEWVRAMNNRRPFDNIETLLETAEETWWSLPASQWREAFDHHPRIGESRASATTTASSTEWSNSEQSVASASPAEERAALTQAQAMYERRFGFIFLVCAAGRTSAELLANLHQRLHNPPDEEFRIAAGEQARITALRLQRMIGNTR